jgi:IPT/TIG domain/S-layer homology domain
MVQRLRVLAGFFLIAAPLLANVTVNDAGDSSNACATTGAGTCTLRDAITYANAHPGSTIAFNIAAGGVQTITPGTPYPSITAPVTIDGYTQPGSSPNSNGPGLGDNSVHLIEIDGTNSGGGNLAAAFAFGAGSDGSVIRGLVINRCPSAAIQILVASGHVIEGNFLGTDPTGSVAHGNDAFGILIDEGASNVTVGGTVASARNLISASGIGGVAFGNDSAAGGSGHHVQGNFIGTNAAGSGALSNDFGISMAYGVTNSTIGGTTPAARNLISGNSGRGVIVSNSLGAAGITGNVIEGNYIGTDVTGVLPLGNGEYGVEVNAAGNTIGGSASGAGNVIGFNASGGIGMEGGADGLVIQGNFIGTDATGTMPLGNQGPAVVISGSNNLIIGGVNPGESNVMAFNGASMSGGVLMYSGTGNAIRGNSIHDNVKTGIDLGGSGPHPNDLGDGDTGANALQNFPIVSAVSYGAHTTVDGLLNSTASTTFDLDFYSNPVCSNFPRDFLQGETYIGSAQVTTNASGNGSFHVTTLDATPVGSRISVTATDPDGNTSEFSQRLDFSDNVHSGDSAGGTALTISGTNFLSGLSVTIGGTPATGVSVDSYTSLSATTPALNPGTANDIVVTNTDETTGTLVKGFVADFLDVPDIQQFHFYVTTLVSNGITAGVGGGLYGINDDTLRQQMAVFLLKAQHGLCYTPPPCTGVFSDVPCSSNFAPWIEAMAAEGITGGCGGGKFCPQNPVRRDQMAVFLMKAEHGSSYVPPTCMSIFDDVPCPGPFADWIEQLYHESITGGCGGNNYCPAMSNTRGQMAVFITKTFNLQ